MNQYQPYSFNQFNPYLQGTQMSQPNYQQYQQPQRQMFPTGLSGRYIADPSEITANDVPMTGSYALFPKNDMSEIYAKAWDANGQIRTLTFKMENPTPEQEKQPETAKIDFTELNERLDRIEKILSARQKTKREVTLDD